MSHLFPYLPGQAGCNPSHDTANVEILTAHLGERKAARTVVCTQLLEPDWLIEVQAFAANQT